jgi:hypothetical protein
MNNEKVKDATKGTLTKTSYPGIYKDSAKKTSDAYVVSYRYYDANGKSKQTMTRGFARIADAKAFQREKHEAYSKKARSCDTTLTLGDHLDTWLTHHSNENNIQETTFDGYATNIQHIRNTWVKYFYLKSYHLTLKNYTPNCKKTGACKEKVALVQQVYDIFTASYQWR